MNEVETGFSFLVVRFLVVFILPSILGACSGPEGIGSPAAPLGAGGAASTARSPAKNKPASGPRAPETISPVGPAAKEGAAAAAPPVVIDAAEAKLPSPVKSDAKEGLAKAGAGSSGKESRRGSTTAQIAEARKQFRVEVLSFDVSTPFGSEPPYSDHVRLRVTNGSGVTLPCLTIRTNRLDASGNVIGWSRAPSLPTAHIGSSETVECDHYPRGQLPGVASITVEIEDDIPPDSLKFFKEFDVPPAVEPPKAPSPPTGSLPRLFEGHGKPVAVGVFNTKDGEVELPDTVTLFADEDRTQGVQIPRRTPVVILSIRRNPKAPEDKEYDLVRVRAGDREGWISRMQFKSMEPVKPEEKAATEQKPAPPRSPEWDPSALLSPNEAGSVIGECIAAGLCPRASMDRIGEAMLDGADISSGKIEIRHVLSAVRKYATRQVHDHEFYKLAENELGRSLRR